MANPIVHFEVLGKDKAALEDFYNTTGPWRARLLATSMFNLHGSGDKNNDLIEQAREVLSKV